MPASRLNLYAAVGISFLVALVLSVYPLPMDWRWWRLAKEKGVRCAINPDAHSVRGLEDLWFGIRTARKGWLTRDDVINCLPLGRIESVLGAKRCR